MKLMDTIKNLPSKARQARATKLAKQNADAIHERNKEAIIQDEREMIQLFGGQERVVSGATAQPRHGDKP